jgi:hypothetical protein
MIVLTALRLVPGAPVKTNRRRELTPSHILSGVPGDDRLKRLEAVS